MKNGLAGLIAKPFINSKLTILLMAAFLLIGIYSSSIIPREEEPQIDVPMADIFVGYPGAEPEEVESRIVKPLEKLISNIKGIEHVYGMAQNDGAMVIVQFYVGEDIERSLVKLYNEIYKHMDEMPMGVTMPLVKSRAIDDVPIMGLTLWSETYDDFQLRRIAEELDNEIKQITDVSVTNVIGGRSRTVDIELNREKIAAFNLDPQQIAGAVQMQNRSLNAGTYDRNDTEFVVRTGKFLASADDVAALVVGQVAGRPIYLREIATITDGPSEPAAYVLHGQSEGLNADAVGPKTVAQNAAVTLSISKRRGADAMNIAEQVIAKTEAIRTKLIPSDVYVEVTRNYGASASEKVAELLMHLIGSIVAVTIVVMLAMGWRGGLVVFLSVPITFALTLFSYYFLDYTLNRITLFALVFVTGIVVDDSIIIAENMHRHFKMKKLPMLQAAMYSINEVGNPTILATFTVVASVLPMAFVSGLMGPYMSPMPIGAALAMLFSLFVAITITPYLGYRILQFRVDKHEDDSEGYDITNSPIYRFYVRFMQPLLDYPSKRWTFIGVTTVLLLATFLLFPLKGVLVKMLPFDNKNEYQVVIDMPEGTTLERTLAVAKEIGQYISEEPMVQHYQIYAGTSAPITFNGLVRHYDLRGGSNMADIQVNLLEKHDRDEQSHDVAKRMRPRIQEIGARYGANVKVVEVPPGPPVLSTLVAEVYGPTDEIRLSIAKQMKELLANTTDVVDIDWMVEDAQPEMQFVVDNEKAMRYGVTPAQINGTLQMLLAKQQIGALYAPADMVQVPIRFGLSESDRSGVAELGQITVVNQQGKSIPLSTFIEVVEGSRKPTIYRKNQRRVTYVTADMAGEGESPVYAILGQTEAIEAFDIPEGYEVKEAYMGAPFTTEDVTVKWDGEWQITLEVFRDLGTAFGVVLIVIYILIVGWFQNFKVPLVMMVAIPLSLVGIILGHWFMGAFFTATSMIGTIALAGIMVRNSVLLIDFINLRLEDGVPLKQAAIEAGAVRTTPILLTAGTVVIGAFVILFDPIFQGLAIALMGGSIASTVLTLLVVPVVYYMTERKNHPEEPMVEDVIEMNPKA